MVTCLEAGFGDGPVGLRADYLIPVVADRGAIVIRRPAEYAEAVLYSSFLYDGLVKPVKLPGNMDWGPSEERLLRAGLYRAFGQHSDRNKLNRIAAAFEEPKSERNYLGRWHADGSDNYLATAMSAVFRIQDKCCCRLRRDITAYDETEGLQRLHKFLLGEGVAEDEAAEAIGAITIDAAHCYQPDVVSTGVEDSSDSESTDSDSAEEAPAAQKYYHVCYSTWMSRWSLGEVSSSFFP